METGEKLDFIPIDLILEIFSRLPPKSTARFRCLSQLWGSMLYDRYFTELFLTVSRARPRLLFVVEQAGDFFLYSLPQPQSTYAKSSSLAVDATDQIKLIDPTCRQLYSCGYASGLICLSDAIISKEYGNKRVICNPSTGQCKSLPKLIRSRMAYDFLGFDPVDKQFKVLSMTIPFGAHDRRHENKILTLRNGEMWWRKKKCPLAHEPSSKAICINGFLYYLAKNIDEMMIVCFNVRSEKFKKLIHAEWSSTNWSGDLINYKGKLGGISLVENDVGAIELSVWVLEDMEKQEWSKYVYTLPDNKLVDMCNVFVAGVTSTGEIVLSMDHASKQFYVFYFNPERGTLRTVEIHGNHQVFDSWNRVYMFVDHVEDPKFDIMKRSPPKQKGKPISISPPPERKRKLMSASTSAKEDHDQQQECDSYCPLERALTNLMLCVF